MDRNDQDLITKIICYGIGTFLAYHILIALLPYIVTFLALMGVGYLFLQYMKNK
jgi:hypothetical protein